MKVSLVTGGATRVGRLITEHLLLSFDIVIIIFNSSKESALSLQKQYGSDRVVLYQCDFNNYSSLHKVFDEIFKKYEISLLVNNASIMKNEKIIDVQYDSLLSHYSIHLFVPILLTQYMIKQTGSFDDRLIINLLDIKIQTNQSKRTSYLLSKKSLADFTQMAALEFAPFVRVNGIALGWIYDPVDKPRSLEKQNEYAQKIPLKRKVNEIELLETVDFLTVNKQLTGQCINLAGGSELKYSLAVS